MIWNHALRLSLVFACTAAAGCGYAPRTGQAGQVVQLHAPATSLDPVASRQVLRGARLFLEARSQAMGSSSDAENQANALLRLRAELELALLRAGAVMVTNVSQPHDLRLVLLFELDTFGNLLAVALRGEANGQLVGMAQVTASDRRAARSASGMAGLLVSRLDQDVGIERYLASRSVVLPAGPSNVAPPSSHANVDTAFVVGAPQPTAYVVAVGIEQYEGLPSPTGARLDAQRFATLASTSLGVPRDHVHLLLDRQATRGSLEKELEWLVQSVPPGGRIYFYFGGHGAPDPSEGSAYLVPFDGDPRYLPATALPISHVTARLGQSRAREAFVLLDSCFSGTGGRSVLASGIRPLVTVKTQQVGAQVALLSAASGAEISGSDPNGQAGLFTSTLLDGLGKGSADLDGDGQISLQELNDWVTPRVARAAKREGRAQTPSLLLGPALGSASSVIVEWGLPEH